MLMEDIRFVTKGTSDPAGKPRVFFTCHPDDFKPWFGKITDDIFRTHDCAVYYTRDMDSAISDSDLATVLGRMNLFVIPVTFRLLTEPNRTLESDLRYARKENIPILPIMLESGIDEIYSRPDKFGELQYLNPYSTDTTQIGYGEKLRRYLDSVLISDEMASRIRAAFDAYIFLSYRKNDRRYANELMRLIHKVPGCRDIAIWYDEFLTPGESFHANIDKILSSSHLFTLLVTPRLLEEPKGKPNYVMGHEYPEAINLGMDILPMEMEKTDRAGLCDKFRDLPECVDPMDDEAFRKRLQQSLLRIAVTAGDGDPEHRFLIGLAYLDGIDMEVDRERGVEMIMSAAGAGLPEAIRKAYMMYDNGVGVGLDYREAVKWAEKLAQHYLSRCGEEHPDTLAVLSDLAATYDKAGGYQKEAQVYERIYAIRCRLLGAEHADTLVTLGKLAMTYGNLGDYPRARELTEKVYHSLAETLGEAHPDTLTALANYAGSCYRTGDCKKAAQLNETVYALRRRVLSEGHLDTITAQANLAFTYGKLGDYQKEAEMEEEIYGLRCRALGENHPKTLLTLGNLAVAYGKLGDHRKTAQLHEKVYRSRCHVLGEEHPDTLVTLSNIAQTHANQGDYGKAAQIQEKLYEIRCRILGEAHPKTLLTLGDLAFVCGRLGQQEKADELNEKVYALRRKVLGDAHPQTLEAKARLSGRGKR